MTTDAKPACVRCRSAKSVVECFNHYYCGSCKIEFDTTAGEDSVACTDPIRSLELKERHTKSYPRRGR